MKNHFFYIHRDYFQYLQYLNIIWNRIRESHRTIGIYYYQEMDLLSKQTSKNLSENEKVKLKSLTTNRHDLLSVLSCDIEAFILFSRRFMDKVGKLVESLNKLDSRLHVENSFSKHKKFFMSLTPYCCKAGKKVGLVSILNLDFVASIS